MYPHSYQIDHFLILQTEELEYRLSSKRDQYLHLWHFMINPPNNNPEQEENLQTHINPPHLSSIICAMFHTP